MSAERLETQEREAITAAKVYFYKQHARMRSGEHGDLAERKSSIAEHLRALGNGAWDGGASHLRVDIIVADEGQKLVTKTLGKQVTRRFSSHSESVDEPGGRPVSWSVEAVGRPGITFFADAETGEIGIKSIHGWTTTFDFLEDESRTLSECEDFLSNIFYLGSRVVHEQVSDMGEYEAVPINT